MEYIKRKLDARFKGYSDWKYVISPKRGQTMVSRRQDFLRIREWCWNTWGPSKEIDFWLDDKKVAEALGQNAHWAWQNDLYNARIYLRTDKELAQFYLTWA
jgi:hypothetical protein